MTNHEQQLAVSTNQSLLRKPLSYVSDDYVQACSRMFKLPSSEHLTHLDYIRELSLTQPLNATNECSMMVKCTSGEEQRDWICLQVEIAARNILE